MVAKLLYWAKEHGTKYRVQELVRSGKLFRIDKGIYSDVQSPPEVEIVLAKYHESVLTMESAYFYYQLSDEIPDAYHLATDRSAAIIHDERVVQCFVPSGTLNVGVVQTVISGESVRIYDKERLLIETMRYRTKLPYDLYREVVDSFRGIRNNLYGSKIDDYLKLFPRREALKESIRREVY